MTAIAVFILHAQYQCFIGAVCYANRHLTVRAKIALNNSVATNISCQRTVGARYNTGPAPNALLLIDNDLSGYRILAHGAGQTGIDTPGLCTVAALNSETNFSLPLYAYAR